MSIIETGKKVLETEANAIYNAIDRIGEEFEQAVDILYNNQGRVVITGMGKSGLIGKKIAATLTSIGIPSFFLHPSEALHGDIGIINDDDVVIALSTSGETPEVIRILSLIKRLGIKLIALVGNATSTLARESDIFLDCGIEKEACPIGLVPTSSTTLTLAVGDAISIALMEKKGFTEEDFRLYHPGGSIGKKLLKVKHLMHTGDELPLTRESALLKEALKIMDAKKFGALIVISESSELKGIITDGDLRRLLLNGFDFSRVVVSECMIKDPLTIREDVMAVEALKIMEEKLITSLVVVNDNQLVGLLHLHDLWRTEMI